MAGWRGGLPLAALLLCALTAAAAEVDGARLPPAYALPFAALLLGIALLPLVAMRFWHHHFGKFVAGCALAFLLPFAAQYGAAAAGAGLVHALVAEYIPFIVLLATLFVVAGGIYFEGRLPGTPRFNTGLLALGTLLASVMGTTGAAMLLIRPLIRANQARPRSVHVFVFFIFLVANAGGALTPLGDPPLFLGFLKGVPFDWMLRNILPHTLFLVACLLALFYAIDRHFHRREGPRQPQGALGDPTAPALRMHGGVNVVLLLGVMALVLGSGLWKPGTAFVWAGTAVGWESLARDAGLIVILLLSLGLTPAHARQGNQFNWAPMAEVAQLFAGIFLTMIPVLAMLRAGLDGPFAPIVATVTGADGQPLPMMYFWATGMLSGFLDNAPTYLVFFNLAGGDPVALTIRLAHTLAAISAGAVFMGALSYIGNAPNLMVKAVVEDRGLRMPGFFGYMAWSACILLPLFGVMSLVWFR
ncbi:MAG: sodium:proton antiporter [Comamonas sp.]